jgi:hypothetical protein
MAAAGGMLDKRHPLLPALRHDDNNYLFGSIGEHLISLIAISSYSMGGLMFVGTACSPGSHTVQQTQILSPDSTVRTCIELSPLRVQGVCLS